MCLCRLESTLFLLVSWVFLGSLLCITLLIISNIILFHQKKKKSFDPAWEINNTILHNCIQHIQISREAITICTLHTWNGVLEKKKKKRRLEIFVYFYLFFYIIKDDNMYIFWISNLWPGKIWQYNRYINRAPKSWSGDIRENE